MKVTRRPVVKYLDSLEEPYRADMLALYKRIGQHMPGVSPVMWEGTFWGGSIQSIIGFGNLTYTRSDKKSVEWFMVGLALQKHYISIYVSATEDGQYLVKKYGKSLGKVKLGNSNISFRRLADVNLDELLKLIDKAAAQLKV